MKDFTKLTDKFDPKNEKDQLALALEMVYYLMKSADDTVTRAIVEGMPYNVATEIIKAVTGGDQSGFQEAKDSPTVTQDTWSGLSFITFHNMTWNPLETYLL